MEEATAQVQSVGGNRQKRVSLNQRVLKRGSKVLQTPDDAVLRAWLGLHASGKAQAIHVVACVSMSLQRASPPMHPFW